MTSARPTTRTLGRYCGIAFGLLCAAAAGGSAQQSGSDGADAVATGPSQCADTLQPANLMRVTVYQEVSAKDTASALVSQLDLVAQRIAIAVRTALGAAGDAVPQADSLGVWMGAGRRLPFVVVVRREGAGSWRRDTNSDTISAKVTNLYAGALRSIPPDSLWMVWPDGYAADSVVFRLMLIAASNTSHLSATTYSLFAVYGTNGLREHPALLMKGQPSPWYPTDAEYRGLVGDVLLQFAIDTQGRADMTTIKVLRPTAATLSTSPFAHFYREFALAAEEAVRHDRFYPARIGTCPVRQLVQFPFSFSKP
ncbi:MAG TPA: energy transducer TonB [Gemmatimonadaceae bacterium]|jgi:hypothetical protein